MDLSKLDDQVVDIVTAWVLCYSTGYNLPSSFDYAHRILTEPAVTIAGQMAQAIRDIALGQRPVSDAFQDLKAMPSRSLQLMLDTYLESWQRPSGLHIDTMRALIDDLWQHHSDPKPPITNHKDILDALSAYGTYRVNSIRKIVRDNLVALGDHLIPYIDCCLMLGCAGPPRVGAFHLLKLARTEGTIKSLRRYAENQYNYFPMAAVILDELGIAYARPENEDKALYCWDCGQPLSNPERIVRTNLHEQAVFCSIEHLSKSMLALTDWV